MPRKVRATQTIYLDGEKKKPGEVFVVSNAVAHELEKADAIEPKNKPQEEAPTTDETPDTPAEVKDNQPETTNEEAPAGPIDYKSMSGGEVLRIAQERGVPGASHLGFDELVDILTKQDLEA